MELKYIVLTIIKILISVPGVLLITTEANGAALMGGHLDNKSNKNITDSYNLDFDLYDEQEFPNSNSTKSRTETSTKDENSKSEEIPDPEKLVVSGYNLPENIFNKGKPFYLEKNPITGIVDFNSKSSLDFDDSEYEYVEDEPNPEIFNKANIDRKDGSLYGHKPSDVNQLTPNFHDFLNLPVKYNPDKYVYPLISSSYANTKIQGNVVKQHNHKDYSGTTYKPSVSPTYYTTKHYLNNYKSTKRTDYPNTTKKPQTPSPTTTKLVNLMNSPMNHPSYDNNNSNLMKIKKPLIKDSYDFTTKPNNVHITTTTLKTTTKVMSLFEQLFGDYDEPEPTTKPPPPALFSKIYPETTTTSKAITEEQNAHNYFNPEEQDVNYDYDDYNNEYPITDNIAVENKPAKVEISPIDKVKYTTTVKPKKQDEIKLKEKTKSNNEKFISKDDVKLQEQTNFKDDVKPKEELKKKEEIKPKEEIKKIEELKHRQDVKKTSEKKETQLDESFFTKPNKTIFDETTKSTTEKVTSLPLGENHISHNNRQPIIVTTTNLKEQLNNEKVPFTPFVKGSLPPSTSNIHIAPDQDVVSFVVGNQQNVDGGQYVGDSFKESPYDHNPFRPLYSEKESQISFNNFPIENRDHYKPEVSGSSVNIQPNRNSEASLTIGKPISNIKTEIPGQVVDDNLNTEDSEYTIGSKIVFPDERSTSTYTPELAHSIQGNKQQMKPLPLVPNREVLKLNSKPMFHQLPSDLTPPNQKEVHLPSRVDRIRPPWDPRPGHFYSGRPEYARPPRPPLPPPPNNEVYKRLDTLPNILPQFRPNARISNGPYHYENVNKKPFVRQPLLDRPSNKPLELMENLQPPPLPKNIHNIRPPTEYEPKLRQNLPVVNDQEYKTRSTEKYVNSEMTKKPIEDQFEFYKTPPKVVMSNRRTTNENTDVETLQMIQAKQTEKKEVNEPTIVVNANQESNDSSEKPLYVVYPVNTPPLKLDVIDNNKKETVVIGTRAELPLPPSEINQFAYDETPLLTVKDRHDAPILKPHPKPLGLPVRSDFPYYIERPDPSILNPAVPEIPTSNNDIDVADKFVQENIFNSNNQWNSLEDAESRIISGSKINAHQSNQISATLKTFTDKPIAVAYTPTEPHYKEYPDKFSMPNYAGAVIPEIRPAGGIGDDNSEFTVSAVMHTHPHIDLATQNMEFINKHKQTDNHRSDNELYTTHVPPQEFQAPFQASVNLDHQSMSQGWTVIRDKNKTDSSTLEPEITTVPIATTSEFDIENFKPQLIGGFKPLYNFPEDESKKETELNERQE